MPSYVKKVKRAKIATYIPPKLKAQIDAAAAKSGLSTARWVQFALEETLKCEKADAR